MSHIVLSHKLFSGWFLHLNRIEQLCILECMMNYYEAKSTQEIVGCDMNGHTECLNRCIIGRVRMICLMGEC